MNKKIKSWRMIVGLSGLILGHDVQAQSSIFSSKAIQHPVIAEHGMVSSQHKLATQVGLSILQSGGNAVDAAVAVGFTLAVVLPRAGNLGGGGFMLIHEAKSGQTKAINYREKAPLSATTDMFLTKKGEVDEALVKTSYKTIGVPGTVAGLSLALEKHGTMSLAEVLAPAILLAEEGFVITHDLERVLKALNERIGQWPESRKIFFKTDSTYFEAGEWLKQKDLAWSLKEMANHGRDAFYKGKIADRIVADMKLNNGLITKKDLRNYQPILTDVVWGSYQGYDIASMPPPSSGGVHLIQMLNVLENFRLDTLKHNSAHSLHLIAEAMKLAYADRSEHLGDPTFWDVPTREIISKTYAAALSKTINIEQATPSADILPGHPRDYESEETTHFSVVDNEGNVVSNTYTINFSFGNGAVAKGTGILMNNELHDFSAKPGTPNAYGLLGSEANKVEPEKRPLSSMTPTIVFREGKPFLVTGSPGGSRIISTVLQVVLNVLTYEMNVAEATHAPRIHHQWYPDLLYHEKSLNWDTRKLLDAYGHNLKTRNAMGSTQTIMIRGGKLHGSADPRRPDAKVLGY